MRRRGFPWRTHRTQAQIIRTEALLAKADAGREKLTPQEVAEFGNLLKKAYQNNPPPSPKEDTAA